jgi:molecular chaperone GrpE
MKKTLKKLFNMTEKDTIPTEQEQHDFHKEADHMEAPAQEADSADLMRIRDLEQQLDEAKNKHLYLLSDFETYKRQTSKERLDLMQTAGRDILSALLPVIDDFERAARNNALSEGVELIHHKLLHTLESKGLKSMNVQKGDAFDADRHEAVAEIPAPDESMKGKIIDVIEQGFLIGERIIRFSRVIVGQ